MQDLNNTTSVAVLGTGTMGAPMARNLARRSFSVRVWNRTFDKARALEADGVAAFEHAADAVDRADIVITMLKDADSVMNAMELAASGLPPHALWLQMSTVGIAGTALLQAYARQLGLHFYDAPVQGTRQPAEQAQLIILASGPLTHRSQAQAVFDAVGKRTIWVSETAGESSRLKLALNHWAFSLTHGLAESLAFAQALGVDLALVVNAVSDGPMDSGFFQAKSAAILKNNFAASFSVVNALKDAQLVVDAAHDAGLRLDGAQAGLQRFERALAAGHGDKDMAASFLA